MTYSLYRLGLRGYPLLGLALLPLACLCCWLLLPQPLRGASINWQQGVWTIREGETVTTVVIDPGSTCLPWLIYLAWREVPGGRRRRLWLFPDSAPVRALRGLRVRLRLER